VHEMTVATALVSQVCHYAASRVNGDGAATPCVSEISVRMGVLSGIARSLYFCFPHAARGTACEGATLRIAEVPLTVWCQRCSEVKSPKGLYNFRCPDCGYPTPKVVTGREMQLVSIAVAENGSGSEQIPSDRSAGSKSASQVRGTMR
jgi:hydrogenase nickel incorporation protein HypA/HybF